jgi:hypothetical protein
MDPQNYGDVANTQTALYSTLLCRVYEHFERMDRFRTCGITPTIDLKRVSS